MPIAPVPLFRLAQKLSNGHAITTILIAMVAMMLTAYSDGRMAGCFLRRFGVHLMSGAASIFIWVSLPVRQC
jgi:hypothetical protein